MNATTPDPLGVYLSALCEQALPYQQLDVRWALPNGGMRRRFIPARTPAVAARLIRALAAGGDVYVGVALRERRAGGKDAIAGSRFLFVDCDEPDAAERHARLQLPATIEVASGRSGHRHFYWRLTSLAEPPAVEAANRRLAVALAGDPTIFDIARILRPPDTYNYKSRPRTAVSLYAYRPAAVYPLGLLLESLPADPAPPAALTREHSLSPRSQSELEVALRAIPAREYVRVLTGRDADRAGKVLCPFHEELNPSLQLYPDGTFYCFGRACRRGGSIFDFAAALWSTGTRDGDFARLCDRLAEQFFLTADRAS